MSEPTVYNIQYPFSGGNSNGQETFPGQPWDALYSDGSAPWDIGEPQPAIVRLASEGAFTGTVLDAGCGTGENTLHLATLGLPVMGIDVAETALAIAQAKADERGVKAEFAATDALQLELLGCKFDTVLDCGLFQALDVIERSEYVESLASVTAREAILYVLCFSDDATNANRYSVNQDELEAAFNASTGWTITAIEPDRFHIREHNSGAPAWLATIKRN
ncbi:MAG: class I SAM-dependent methyltransferase [Gammaproteobacteria bacterium]|nr:class I SAM-dependent methyltransferase [Gammaproteobacteria bacterium]MDE2346854.1 class I SAM-dependent methyltransferase [Gammaproteobacteria bacterium]